MEGHSGKSSHASIHLLIQQKPQARGLEGYGSGSSAPPTPQRFIPIEMDDQRLNLASHPAELGESFKICLKDIPFKYLMLITEGWSLNRKLKLLEERAARIRENQATIQSIEKN
ncbi:hypothetical protein O181_023766 [Austropuccinia psidii MF-1]|uniref:Uncharacterized protein n=1 Tax=Austropuccinia psidii MF-1 TaxID=1389203 RepID=A0A9Q3CFD1_9BASI|nr:hypothetical protein [Austropuccinia psidii MF-1]